MDAATLGDIHRFWFGELKSPDDLPRDKIDTWFRQSDETNNAIRERFGRFLPEAAATQWNLAALSREEAVGLVILLDQFPRNLFRQSGEAFAHDAQARDIALALLAVGPQRYFHIERVFIALPFGHSEDIEDQDYAVLVCAELAVSAPPVVKDYCRGTLDYATKHRDIIRKFGRFPHRNAVLGRKSTAEEESFLAEKGRGY